MNSRLLAHLALPALICLLPSVTVHEGLRQPAPWIAFLIGFVLLASQPTPSPREMANASSDDRRSALWIYVGMILPQLVASLDFVFLRNASVRTFNPWLVGGTVLAAVSLAFRIAAIRALGRFFTATVQVQSEQRVIDSGPYRVIRHPSYTGALGIAVGVALVFHSAMGLALVAVLAIPAYVYRMTVEEAALSARLGPNYVEYMGRTKRLIPFVY
jgi:protein-S-isoprenylcysteine O-methyltransferase